MTTQQILQKLQQVNAGNIYNTPVTQPILDAQQIKNIAEAQAKIALDELMKQEQEKRKRTFLTIENIDKIRGSKYSEALYVGGVKEWDNHYEFTLLGYSSNQIETILLHRRQTDDKRYVMEYKGHTLWLTKDELSSIDKIIECMTKV